MALGLPATARDDVAGGGQLLVQYLQASSVPVMDSKPSRVPEPASRPMQDDLGVGRRPPRSSW